MTRTPISDKNLFDEDDGEVNFFYWSGLSTVQFRLITNTKIPLAGLRTFLRSLKETSWYFAKIDQLIQLIQLIQLTLENYVKPKDNFCYLRLTWK